MAVFVSGTVLASLFYDHSVSVCDQKGFLVGDVVNHVTDTISDSQMNNSEVETRIYVYDHVACPPDRKIFDTQGNIQESQILDVLKEKHKSVVGWYSFRRGSTMRPSFRERLIHQNLSLSISQDHQSDFVFMLCTSKFTSNLSTHSFDHGFLKLTNNMFKKVPMTVMNLGDTTHTEYRQIPSHTVSNTTGIYSLIVRHHEQEFLNAQGQVEINRITALSNSLHRQLENISREVESSERQLAELEVEVEKHRKEVKYKLLEQAAATSSTVIHEHMEHTDLKQPKQPSIDEILSMEDTEADAVTLSHPTPNFDLSDTDFLSHSPKSASEVTANLMDTRQASSESDTEYTKNKKEIKLTAAVSLHEKVDIKVGRSISISKSESAKPSVLKVANDDKSVGQKSSDPFSFVSSIIQDSKTGEKVNTRSKSTMEVQKGEEIKRPMSTRHKGHNDSKVPQDKVVTVTRQKSDRESAAVLAAASAIANQGERLKSTRSQTKGQGQKDKLSDKSEIVDDELSDGNEKKRTKSRINETSKHCSQEADEEKSQSSQDTYDMDVSSSPVY